jgi:peptide/nickel transport system ATP-binding protein
VVANLADRIAVMYAGKIIEIGSRDELFAAGQHPYTRKLLSSVPDITGERALRGIPGCAAPRPAPQRLRLHPALRLGDRALQRGVPAARGTDRRAPRALLAWLGGRRPPGSCPDKGPAL